MSYLLQRILKRRGSLLHVRVKNIRHPLYLRNGSYDIHVFYQIFVRREFDMEMHGEVKTILDLGGNIGLASIFFANRFPDANIVSVEPDQGNFRLLTQNVEKYPLIRAMNKAVFSKDCTMYLVDTGDGEASYQVTEHSTGQTVLGTVNCLSVPSIMQTHGFRQVDVIKMDIEGSEEATLLENSGWTANARIVMVEIHEQFKPGLYNRICDHLTSGFRISQHGEYTLFERRG